MFYGIRDQYFQLDHGSTSYVVFNSLEEAIKEINGHQ